MAHFKEDHKSIAEKRHNIDLVGSKWLNDVDFAWRASYRQRALLVRLLNDPPDKKHGTLAAYDIRKVKFFTKEEDSHGTLISEADYDFSSGYQQFDLSNFYNFLKTMNCVLEPLEQSEKTVKYWREIVSCLELFELRYEKNSDKVDYWSSPKLPKEDKELNGALQKLSKEQKDYVSAFLEALATDMRNGHAKIWIEGLIKIVLLCFESDQLRPDVKSFAPSQDENTNTVLETVIRGDSSLRTELLFNAPYCGNSLSNSSSLLSLSSLSLESPEYAGESSAKGAKENESKVKRHTIVPDYCVALPDFPGIFPLVFELKPAFLEVTAFVQNMEQMLTKLFFQDVAFGLVVSARQFQLSAIIKAEGALHFASTTPIPIVQIEKKGRMLNLKKIDTMFNFIYRVLEWANTTKCLLPKKISHEKEGDPQVPT